MTICHLQAAGTIELDFYGELDQAARADVERHLTSCADCRQAVEDMQTIRTALASRRDVCEPPGGDWSGFMTRLDDAVRVQTKSAYSRSGSVRYPGRYVVYAAAAALVALVSISVAYVTTSRRHLVESATSPPVENGANIAQSQEPLEVTPPRALSEKAAFASLSEQHFERSKLVVYSLANKDARRADDWAYERQLASTLLSDTRLYRLAAEERGLTSVARVMGDLELVLLQTSLSSDQEPATLQQIQRLIRKRDLVTKMDVVATGF